MSTGKKVFVALVMALVLLVVAGIVYFWLRPIAVAMLFERRALARNGFSRVVLQAPGGQMTVWEAGQGPTLIFLHGAGDHAGAWALAAGFTRQYRVLIPDLPGHAESAPREGVLPLATVLGGVGALIEHRAGNQPAVLVGNSLGAWLALLYAREHPERVARVVAVNGGALRGQGISLVPKDREQARELMALLRDPDSPAIPGFVLDDVVRTSQQGPIGRLAETAKDMERYLLDGRLGEVRTPVDLLWGESDKLLDLDYARRMESQLPAARLTTIPRCGHVPMRECPIAFLRTIEGVLQQPPPAPREAAPASAGAKEAPVKP